MKILEYLWENSISVTKFSEQLGISRQYLSALIHGKLPMTKKMVFLFAKATNGKVKLTLKKRKGQHAKESD